MIYLPLLLTYRMIYLPFIVNKKTPNDLPPFIVNILWALTSHECK